jgi:hypothetical protein
MKKYKYIVYSVIILVLLLFMGYRIKISNENINRITDVEQLINKYMLEYNDYPVNILQDKILDKKKIVFSFTEDCCETCVSKLFNILMNETGIDSSNTIILTAYGNERLLNVYLVTNHINWSVINVKNKDELPFTKLNIPYFFIYDPEKRKMQSFFLPIISDRKRTIDYLKNITVKINKN